MSKILFFTNVKNSITFILKHVFLFTINNILLDLCFFRKISQILGPNHSLVNFKHYSKLTLILFVCSYIFFVVKSILYCTAAEDDSTGAKTGFLDYFSEIFDRFFAVLSTGLMFIGFTIITSILLILPGLFFINCGIYFIVYCAGKTPRIKSLNETKSKYIGFETISKSWEICEYKRFKLVFTNLLMCALTYFTLIYINTRTFSISYYGNINNLLKLLLLDTFLIFIIQTGFTLDRLDSEDLEESISQEKQKKYEMEKSNIDYSLDRKVKQAKGLSEFYEPKKLR